jgi:hypothetical protein
MEFRLTSNPGIPEYRDLAFCLRIPTLVINPEKCVFAVASFVSLSHLVSAQGDRSLAIYLEAFERRLFCPLLFRFEEIGSGYSTNVYDGNTIMLPIPKKFCKIYCTANLL